MQYLTNLLYHIRVRLAKDRKLRCCLLIAAMLVVLGICWTAGKRYDAQPIVRDKAPAADNLEKSFSYLAITKLDRITEPDNPKTIELTEELEKLEITDGGDYILSGKLNGTIHISAREQNVHLFLNGVEITSTVGPAIYCEDADKLTITLQPGTENFISDSGKYLADEEMESCIFSVCDVTLNGTGSLTVNGLYKDAIRSRDIVKILDGNYTIKCKRTAIHGNDGIQISGGSFFISTEKYAMKTTKSGIHGRGNLMVLGGNFSIIAGRTAFVTTKADLYVYDCTIQQVSIVTTYEVGGVARIEEGCIS